VSAWGSRGTNELVDRMRTSMPLGNPGALPEETYAAIAAYVLQFNGGSSNGQVLTARTTTRISDAVTGGVATPGLAAAVPSGRSGVTVAGTVPNFVPVTDAMLRHPKPEDWLVFRHDYSATSYSPLTQITAGNVAQLELA